ncbi:MAG TPA: TSUP family transporter, partial [bacterium]|nr:TSUP family transporter [bacterium]
MASNVIVLIGFGILVGIGAAFAGLGGGFLVVPVLIFLGYTAQRAVGTSFLTILVISISALIAHNRLAN